ncbi:MAG: HdeD family acid-resistance protein [Clostridia bacterium]
MSDFLKRIKWSTLISAVLTMVIGIFLLARPDAAVATISVIVGWILLISGIFSVILFFAGRTIGFAYLNIILGVIGIVLGLWIVIDPDFIADFIMVLLGILLLVHGAVDLQSSFELKKLGGSRWGLDMIFAFLTMALGVMVIILHFNAAKLIMILCGISLILDSVTDFIIVARLARAQKISKKLEQ